MGKRSRRPFQRRKEAPDLSKWVPRTQLGKLVMSGDIKSLDEILAKGQKILEPEIVDFLLPDLDEEVIEIKNTQRMTTCGRKMTMRAVLLIGDKKGHVAMGVGKAPETRDAIQEALKDAKKNMMCVPLGCGSWECGCGTAHSVPMRVKGKSANTEITILPAPRGVGLVAGGTSRKVLAISGVRDVWCTAHGRTRNALNVVTATLDALNALNKQKKGKVDLK